jgi:hypothetical protein
MMSANMRIHVKIPAPISSGGDNTCRVPYFRDGNGVVYQINAIEDACEASKSGLPIIRHQGDGQAETIGFADTVMWNPEGFIEVDGSLQFGGTSEWVVFDGDKNVEFMTIRSIGL